jgi:hypothetical protein
MNFLLFNLFSSFENIAIIVLTLSIFKYRVLDFIPQILLTSLIMSLISHTMRFEFDNSQFVFFILIITLFIFVWLAFRVSYFYALIISVIGIFTYGLLQAILIYVLEFMGLLSMEVAQRPYSKLGYIMQFVTSIFALCISYLLRQKNYGFNWIPYSRSAKYKLKGSNIVLLMVSIVSVFVIGLVFYLYLSGYLHLFAIFILFFIVLVLLFYLSGKQEGKYYD